MQKSNENPIRGFNEESLEGEYVLVLQQLINILQQAQQIGNPTSNQWLYLAHDVARKATTHLLTLLYISRGTNLPDLELEGQKISFTDYSSANIVVRSALEAYLTFFDIFVRPDDYERDFLLKVWDMNDFKGRLKITASSKEGKEKIESIINQVNVLQKNLESDQYFLRLNKNQKKKAVKGDWRLGRTWLELANSAGFSEKLFYGAYGMLSSEAHSGKTSINKLQSTLSQESQMAQLALPLKYGLIVMSQLIFNYAKLYPEGSFEFDSEKMAIIAGAWKDVSENLFV